MYMMKSLDTAQWEVGIFLSFCTNDFATTTSLLEEVYY